MSVQNQTFYTVEFECPHYGIVYYQNILADSIANAKLQIQQGHPDMIIRAVTLYQNENENTEETEINP